MQPKSEAEKQLDVPAGATGCAGDSTFQSWHAGELEQRALTQTFLGRIVLAFRALVERMVK